MTSEEVLRAFDSLRVWQRGGRRAVHKPLLVLLALGRLARGEPRTAEFSELEGRLRRLLEEFGPSGAAKSTNYPFWHLRTDGVWRLEGPSSILDRPAKATPTLRELRRAHVAGGLAPEIVSALRRRPELIAVLARRIVEAHFPESIQQDVLDAAGLPSAVEGAAEPAGGSREAVPRRDPAFRERVLRAYEYRCCICRYDLRLGGQVVGLEAAHIKWFQAGGPDLEANGLALCSLHHKLFDLGGFKVVPDTFAVIVSQNLVGSPEARDKMLAYHGAGIVLPQSEQYFPRPEFLRWQAAQVFKGPDRDV